MPEFKIVRFPISWPDRCAACGSQAATTSRSSCRVMTKAMHYGILIKWNETQAAIDYPVCRRHRWISAIAGRFSERNSWNLGLGVLAGFCFIYISTQSYSRVFKGRPIEDPSAFCVCLAFVSAAILIFFLARRFTPVKLTDIDQQGVTISIRNDDYAKDFGLINATRVR